MVSGLTLARIREIISNLEECIIIGMVIDMNKFIETEA
jgi:hypothetical protein